MTLSAVCPRLSLVLGSESSFFIEFLRIESMKTSNRLPGRIALLAVSSLILIAAVPAVSLASSQNYRDAREEVRDSRREVRESERELRNAVRRNDRRAVRRAYRSLQRDREDLREAKQDLNRLGRRYGSSPYYPRQTELRNGGRRYPGTYPHIPRNYSNNYSATYYPVWNTPNVRPDRDCMNPPRPRNHYDYRFYRR